MILHHLRTNAIAYLALLVATGGTSYAAVQLPDGSVTTPKLHADAVTSPKIRDGSVRQGDLAPASVNGRTIRNGTVGTIDLVEGVLPPGGWVDGSSQSASDPVAAPDALRLKHPFTVPRGGTLLASVVSPRIGQDCSAGTPYAGLYLDGAPVAGSRQVLNPFASPVTLALAQTVPITSGAHEVSVGVDCPDGTLGNAVTTFNASWVLILQ